MAEHVLEWLNAYLDHELNGRRREQVEKHLVDCPACQAELAALRRLSQALQESEATPELPIAERFTAQVMLRLPRQQIKPSQSTARELSWWLAPAAILVAWAFLQAVFLLSTGVWTAGQAGLLGETASWLAPGTQEIGTMMGIFQWLGMAPGDTARQIAVISENFGWNTLVQLVLEAGLGLVYLGWLAAWWGRRHQSGAGLTPAANQKNSV